jgi:RNA polymerase sigma factor (sigma-70 family)
MTRKDWTSEVQAAREDSAALISLLQQFDNLIQAACRRFAVPAAERDDLLQEAYLGFLKAVYTFDPSKSSGFPGYAKAKTREAVWQYIRVRNRRHSRELADRPAGDGEEETNSTVLEQWPDGTSAEAFSELEWRSLLRSLSEREMLVVERIVIDGMTMAELARQERVSPDTVKTWKKRAFAKIRAELGR